MGRTRFILIATCFTALAWAGRETTPELDAERDLLIDKIARGVELEGSVRRFKQLVQERDQKIATSSAAVERERKERDARREWHDAYKKTADYEVSWRCTLAVDPANPPPSDEGRFKGDWGKVIRKEQIRLPPKNELDEGEPATMYEIKGAKQSYIVWGEQFGFHHGQKFEADKGDLVLVCASGSRTDKRLPPQWATDKLQTGGFAARIAAPPLIVKKQKWNPTHITGSRFFWAIREVKWKYGDAFVLSNIEIAEDLGGGRYRIEADNARSMDWILEVPAQLKNRELLVAGRAVWAIMGHHRFDKMLKKLVLVAEDLEARYVVEK
jgi:hypothetical protein